MPIKALPASATRVLVSSVALNDAKSVVKELVDNALDARASTISIEISANTLDVIQVKDNGIGIGVEDRQLLCRRGCTSKIRSLDDLDRLGGTFLGFRGEALASMAELSQAVIVTTRVDGEVAGTSLKYGALGMLSSSSASHPVGTTIRIHDFLARIPVRKQTSLKSTAKTLQAIKAVLFEFAFARRDVRFSLKVLKAKNDKMNWTYAASTGDSFTEVAAKIVGKEIASQCTALSISSKDSDAEVENGWEIDALLVSPNIDKIRRCRQYISIDGRPVTPDRRTMKDIIQMYQRYLQQTLDSSESSVISRPFLALHIRCPPRSYDVNIEPTKDEVLFFRPDLLLSLVERLFRKVYENIDNGAEAPNRLRGNSEIASKSPTVTDMPDPDDLEVRKTPVQSKDCVKSNDAEDTATPNRAYMNPFTIAAMNATVGPKKMEVLGPSTTSDFDRVAKSGQDSSGPSNKPPRIPSSHRTPLGSGTYLASPSASEMSVTRHHILSLSRKPRTSSTRLSEDEETQPSHEDLPLQAQHPRSKGLQAWLTPDSAMRRPHRDGFVNRVRQVETSSEKSFTDSLSSPAEPQRDASPVPIRSYGGLTWGAGQKPFKPPFKPHFHGHSAQATLRENCSHATDQATQRGDRTGHVIPEQVIADDEAGGSGERVPHLSNLGSDALTSNQELNDIMDFEHRKKAAIAHHRRLVGGSQSATLKEVIGRSRQTHGLAASPTESEDVDDPENADYAAQFNDDQARAHKPTASNPHRNRYQAALRDLSHFHPNDKSATMTVEASVPAGGSPASEAGSMHGRLPEDDPRVYFMKLRQKNGGSKPYRTKSSRLPLESIPEGAETVHLVLITEAFDNMKVLKNQIGALATTDRYVTLGRTEDTDLSQWQMTSDCEHILRETVKAKYRFKAEDGRALVPHLKIAISKPLDGDAAR